MSPYPKLILSPRWVAVTADEALSSPRPGPWVMRKMSKETYIYEKRPTNYSCTCMLKGLLWKALFIDTKRDLQIETDTKSPTKTKRDLHIETYTTRLTKRVWQLLHLYVRRASLEDSFYRYEKRPTKKTLVPHKCQKRPIFSHNNELYSIYMCICIYIGIYICIYI